VHSATRFLGGHGDVVAGAVCCDESWAARLRRCGSSPARCFIPLAAFLLHRSLPTLSLRVREAQERARALAGLLVNHPLVTRVHYPKPDGVQLRGPGAVLAFEVAGGLETARTVMASVRLITPAVSLGAVDTLIEHPAGLTHRLVDAKARAAAGITNGLLRLSVGLEDADDLWHDLDRALDAARLRAVA
jgi:methionine-gamma-lyase